MARKLHVLTLAFIILVSGIVSIPALAPIPRTSHDELRLASAPLTPPGSLTGDETAFRLEYLFGDQYFTNGTSSLIDDHGTYTAFGNFTGFSYNTSTPRTANFLYLHNETLTIGGKPFNFLKANIADNSTTPVTVAANSTARKSLGNWTIQLTGISTISNTTWTFYYRANVSDSSIGAHIDVDIVIRMANGTVRSSPVFSHVGASTNLTTTMSIVTGMFTPSGPISVLNQTDYLEIQYYAHVETPASGGSIRFEVEGASIPRTDQTRISTTIPVFHDSVSWSVPVFNATGGMKPITLMFTWSGNVTGPNSATATFGSTQLATRTGNFAREVVPENVTASIGLTKQLTFTFSSRGSASGKMNITISGILLLARTRETNATSHTMTLDSSFTSVDHVGTIPFSYNVSAESPNEPSHEWRFVNVTFSYWSTYNLVNITLVSPADLIASSEPPSGWRNATSGNYRIITKNLKPSYLTVNTNATIRGQNTNFIQSVTLLNQGVLQSGPVPIYVPGDTVTANVTKRLSDAGTFLNFTFAPPAPASPIDGRHNSTSRIHLVNQTVTSGTQLGNWNLAFLHKSGVELGWRSSQLTVRVLTATGDWSGGNQRLTVTGNAQVNSGTSSPTASNVSVFLVAKGESAVPVLNVGTPALDRLYVANVSVRNPLAVQGAELRIDFAIRNPTSSSASLKNITLTHFWPGGASHGVDATFTITSPALGEVESFNAGETRFYTATIAFSGPALRISLRSERTDGQETKTTAVGTEPVFTSRAHAGLFRIQAGSPPGFHFTDSPPYAFLLSPVLGRVAEYGSNSSSASGSYTVTLQNVPNILRASNLTLAVFARDSQGVTIGQADPFVKFDKTLVTAEISAPETGPNSQVTITAKLNASSQTLVLTLSPELTVHVDPVTPLKVSSTPSIVSLSPSAREATVQFTFMAPSGAGDYDIDLSSAEYGVVEASSLKVRVFPSFLQYAIPLALALAVGLGLVAWYALKRRPAEEEPVEKVKERPKEKPRPGAPPPKPKDERRGGPPPKREDRG